MNTLNNLTFLSPQPADTPDQFNEGDYHLKSPRRTFGHDIVTSSNLQAAAIERMSRLDQDSDEYRRAERSAHFFGKSALWQLGDVRTELQSLSTEAGREVGAYLDVSLPLHLLSLLNPNALSDEYISDRHSAEDIMDSIKTISDDVLLNLLQWHNHAVEQQSESEEVQRAFRVYKNRFLVAANKLYDGDYFALPPKDIDDASLVVGDVFDTVVKERGGYYQHGLGEVVVTQGRGLTQEERIDSFRDEFTRVLIHEFVHMYLNRSLEDQYSPVTARWLNEALTEQISRNIRKEMDQFDETDTTYAAERRLLRLVISKSAQPEVTTKLATRSFSGTESDRQAFITHIDEVWGATDVLEKIETALLEEEQRLTELGAHPTLRDIEREALITMYHRLREDPQSLLWAVGDRVIENNGKVAQENGNKK